MSKIIFRLFLSVTLIILLAGVSNSVKAEGVDLGGGIKTGMKLQEVKQILADTENPDLELSNSGTIEFYDRKGTRAEYCFNAATKELVYMLVHYDIKFLSDIKEKVKKECGNPVAVQENKIIPDNYIYYYESSEKKGYKLFTKFKKERCQLWVGDIIMWDNIAKDSYLHKWPE